MPTAIPHPSAPPTCHGRWMSPDFEPGLVSVIVPTYNRAHLIVETLDSVFAQTYRPIELLIVDDGSTDNTAEVVGEWRDAHQQEGFTIRFLTQKNSGAPAARNLGLIESCGEFIQFLDSDDLIHPEKVELQTSLFFENPNLLFVFSQRGKFIDKPNWELSPQRIGLRPGTLENHLSARQYIDTEIGLYRRSVCVRIGPWNESLKRGQEREYNARLLMGTSAVKGEIRKLTLVRHHTLGRISDSWATAEGARAATEASQAIAHALRGYSRLEKPVRNIIAKHFAAEGRMALKVSDFQLAAECSRCGWEMKPDRIIQWHLRFVDLFTTLPPNVYKGCTRFVKMLPRRTPYRHAFVVE